MKKPAVFWLILWACGWGLGARAAESGAMRPADGPVGLTLTLSSSRSQGWEPILAVGRPGSGDVVFCRKLGDGRTVFGWQQTGHMAFLSDPIRLPENVPLEVMISLGSFFPEDESGAPMIRKELRELALVQVQGRTVLIARGTFVRAGSAPETGTNHIGGSFASTAFSGRIANLHRVSEDIAFAAATFPGSLVAEEEVTREAPEYPGALVFQLLFPPNASGRNEPLVVTGKTGAGDILFIRYVDSGHVQLGFDHWLKGGPISEIFACNFAEPHAVTLAMGSLFPPVTAAQPDSPELAKLRTRCVVLFDGKPAIDWPTPFYAATAEQIFIGANPIGGSSADAFFNGTIVKITRVRPEHLLLAP